jgi:CHASE2 domain-containing sensor protein
MTAAGKALTRLVPTRERVIRLLRNDVLKALIGTHLVVAAIILVRSQGWLQPFELAIYDQLRVVWADHEPSANILLVGGTEEDIRRLRWPTCPRS